MLLQIFVIVSPQKICLTVFTAIFTLSKELKTNQNLYLYIWARLQYTYGHKHIIHYSQTWLTLHSCYSKVSHQECIHADFFLSTSKYMVFRKGRLKLLELIVIINLNKKYQVKKGAGISYLGLSPIIYLVQKLLTQ